jgi:hypothetical protein
MKAPQMAPPRRQKKSIRAHEDRGIPQKRPNFMETKLVVDRPIEDRSKGSEAISGVWVNSPTAGIRINNPDMTKKMPIPKISIGEDILILDTIVEPFLFEGNSPNFFSKLSQKTP